MSWVAARRFRNEPIRVATLAILFAATMLAAIMLPRQIRAALDARATVEGGVKISTGSAADNSGTAWWTPPAARAAPESTHHRTHKANRCRNGCKTSDEPRTAQ